MFQPAVSPEIVDVPNFDSWPERIKQQHPEEPSDDLTEPFQFERRRWTDSELNHYSLALDEKDGVSKLDEIEDDPEVPEAAVAQSYEEYYTPWTKDWADKEEDIDDPRSGEYKWMYRLRAFDKKCKPSHRFTFSTFPEPLEERLWDELDGVVARTDGSVINTANKEKAPSSI